MTKVKCRKKGYPNARTAHCAIDRIQSDSKRETKPNRCYCCPTCGKWHLSSKEYRP